MAPLVATLRKKAHGLATAVANKLESPTQALERFQFQPAATSAIRVAQDAGWLYKLRDGKEHTAHDLLGKGQDVELLIRIMRILSASKAVDEVGEARYRANKTTLFLCEEGVSAGMAHWFDNMAPVFVNMPSYFRKNNYQEPVAQESGPYHSLFDQTYWERLSNEPHLYQDLNTYMQAHKKSGSALAAIYPIERLQNGFSPIHSDAFLVDVGGGKGHQLIDLANKYPNTPGNLILQDLPDVLPEIDAQKEMAKQKISCMAHNFFKPQPVHGARCYYFSAILHDWPDQACSDILRNTVSAMVPGYSKLLINGIILPPSKASYFEACKDYGMMAAMSAKERTLRQLQDLAEREGLRIVKVFPGLKGHDFVMELDLVGRVEEISSLVNRITIPDSIKEKALTKVEEITVTIEQVRKCSTEAVKTPTRLPSICA